MTELPQPIRNADSEHYWEAMQSSSLHLQICKDCGKIEFMPRHMCTACWSPNRDWIEASGHGTVHSFSIVHRASDPAFTSRVPYVVALIDLEEGVRMPSSIAGDDALSVAIGDAVKMTFEDRGSTKLAVFTLDK